MISFIASSGSIPRSSSRITNCEMIPDTMTQVTHGTTIPQNIQSGTPSTNVKSAVVPPEPFIAIYVTHHAAAVPQIANTISASRHALCRTGSEERGFIEEERGGGIECGRRGQYK